MQEEGHVATPELREKLAADPQRPQYHFLPPANWMNDPNGLLFWKGEYHIFYQHNPNGPFFATMHWGHATSRDLAHWKHLPVALKPGPGGPDKNHCGTGHAVVKDGVPTIIYTAYEPYKVDTPQCIATSHEDMVTWEKYEGNPVVSSPPDGMELTGFRDPCVWKEGKKWYMIVGSGVKGVGGAPLLYESNDLVHWGYLHPLCTGEREKTGDMWECPDFFPLGNKHVLLASVHRQFGSPITTTVYFVGTYTNHRFWAEIQGRTDLGPDFYAARTIVDDKGRRILFGWLWEARSDPAQRASGWAGVLSLPRELSLREDGTLTIAPVPELEILRGEHYHYEDVDVTPNRSLALDSLRADCIEIVGEFDTGDSEELGLRVRCAPDRSEETVISYDRRNRRLNFDRERSSLSPDVKRGVHGGPLELEPGEPLRLHIFLDKSIVEVFANGRACLSGRVYPSRPDSLGLAFFARGGQAKVKSLTAWTMESAWKCGPAD